MHAHRSLRRRIALCTAGTLAAPVAGCRVGANSTGHIHAETVGDLTYAPAARGDGASEIDAACRPTGGAGTTVSLSRKPYLQPGDGAGGGSRPAGR